MSPSLHKSSARLHKRVRFSDDGDSEPSTSTESNFAPTSVADDSTDATNYDSDTESELSLSESSEEPSDESSSEEEEDDTSDVDMELDEQEGQDGIVNLRANKGKKPVMKLGDEDLGPDIRTFLKDFLPQLKAANDELEAQKKAGTLKSLDADEAEEGAPYIEMDLGLGVLEAKDANADSASDSASDTEDGEGEKDILGKLMGREKTHDTAGIEVVQNEMSS